MSADREPIPHRIKPLRSSLLALAILAPTLVGTLASKPVIAQETPLTEIATPTVQATPCPENTFPFEINKGEIWCLKPLLAATATPSPTLPPTPAATPTPELPQIYTQFEDANGITIKAYPAVDPRALHRAAETMNMLTGYREDIRAR